MNYQLSIIIVTFNSSEVIKRCLSNLNKNKYNIVVVDNNSTDNTIQIIAHNFPKVKIIKNNNNVGYGRANNIALRQAKTDFALILNPDAIILEKDIEISLAVLKNHQNIALASPHIVGQIELMNQPITTKNTDYSPKDFIAGGILFMNLIIMKKVGFFNEDFFMFAEDNELSDRAKQNGYQNAIIENAIAFHYGGESSKKSLRNTYRRFWHLGWSKSKYKQGRKNKFNIIRSTLRLTTVHFVEGIFYFITRNIEKSVSKFAFSFGCFSFLIGLKSFKKNGKPRG